MNYKESAVPQTDRYKDQAVDWLASNAATFHRGLHQFRADTYKEVIAYISGKTKMFYDMRNIDPLFRRFEEMGVCTYWKQVELPEGMSVVSGAVKPLDREVWGNELARLSDHTFATVSNGLTSNPVILDHCVAQFMVGSAIPRGERLKKLQEKAPNLFQTVRTPYGSLTMLVGRQNEIRDQLGIQYYDEPRHAS